jgi:NADH dehydrogenase/NADH:ubiquinone oxidoreductase subunit G
MIFSASEPGICELGGGRAPPRNADCLYLVGADSEKLKGGNFIIYQGHHGDIGARSADVILPATAYSEKNGTYISIYHRARQTKAVVQS